MLSTFTPLFAEIWLAVAGMALLMIGVFRGKSSTHLVAGLTVGAFIVAFIAIAGDMSRPGVALGGLFIVDEFAVFMKTLVLLGAGLTLILSLGFIRRENMDRFEFPVLVLFATLGMLMIISANDLISLYMGLCSSSPM